MTRKLTHKDIFTKYMIEYDKANVTSSYPSLTEYEQATALDKAYMALIAQKVTGNNVRRAPFEADVKSISDLQPLVVVKLKDLQDDSFNIKKADIPDDFLYFVNAFCLKSMYEGDKIDPTPEEFPVPLDDISSRYLPISLATHAIALKFITSPSNLPWIKNPIAYIEDNNIYVVVDSITQMTLNKVKITYIKHPNVFQKFDLLLEGDSFAEPNPIAIQFVKGEEQESPYETLTTQSKVEEHLKLWDFELDDVVAEELISLAISYTLENVESPRLNTHLGMRGLES